MSILSNIAIYGGAFVIVLSVVVFVHEFGHFQVARWRKVAIDTFSIGFGKTLLGWRDKQGVQWKIGALPLGGYVKFTDDADAMSTAPVEQIDDPVAKAEARKRGLFHAQPLDTRAMVVAAGPITNFIFSILAFATVLFVMGRDVTEASQIPARIAEVRENSAAAQAGLRVGDVVRSVDGAAVANFDALRATVAASPGRALTLQVERDGRMMNMSVTPQAAPAGQANITAGQGMLGVTGPLPLQSELRYEPVGPLDALGYGAKRTWTMVTDTFGYIGRIFVGRESGNQIAGPLGIISVSGQVATSALDAPDASLPQRLKLLGLALLSLAAILSVAVGIVNLLPIPILDGGHLLFYLIEGLRGGKPLPPSAQEWAYRAGFAVMASLFLFATWNDISRLVGAQ